MSEPVQSPLPSDDPVAFARCHSYNPEEVQAAADRLFDLLGGVRSIIRSGRKVLLKPNLLLPRSVQKAPVLTHPEVIRAVARRLLEAGGQVTVGDGCALGSSTSCLKKIGIFDDLQQMGARVRDFDETVSVPGLPWGTHKRFDIAREVIDADLVINLPKAKTHGQMVATLAVKNTFGYIVGTRKTGWHLKAGTDYHAFARMLLELHYVKKPALNLIDAVIGMEGEGPSSGTPKPLNFLAASADPVRLDTLVASIFRLNPLDVYVLEQARLKGLYTEPNGIPVLGDDWRAFIPEKFVPPKSHNLAGPAFVSRLFSPFIVSTPKARPDLCVGCGICLKACPAKAITIEDKLAHVNTSLCIRCYCCQELCPEKAMQIRRGLRIFG